LRELPFGDQAIKGLRKLDLWGAQAAAADGGGPVERTIAPSKIVILLILLNFSKMRGYLRKRSEAAPAVWRQTGIEDFCAALRADAALRYSPAFVLGSLVLTLFTVGHFAVSDPVVVAV
jgi:hypothetical protein